MNAINAYNRLNANVAGLKKASEKLASGYRINRAGDDAAGLAISEKMRSQIKGLNQAVRNSQDGINMIQTYEGAAQETHSILQRMKELAVESANGTYDNATDRAAIQLEFDQLNDELNQIADTDFNGTVVLNGGVMADGTVAKGGEFRYANGYTETVVADQATDISGDQEHTIADQSFYDKVKADAVYDALGVKVADVADSTGAATVNVTFMYDGERWVADTVTDTKGNIVKGANAAGLEARPVDRTDASGKGGFQVIAGKDPYTSKDIIATNAIFDEMTPVKKGDTVTISFDNTAKTTYAPKNIGIDECYDDSKPFKSSDDTKITSADMINKVEVKLASGVTDSAMTKELETALKALDAAKFTVAYDSGVAGDVTVAAPADTTGLSADVVAAIANITVTDGNIVYDDGAGTTYNLGTISFKSITADLAAMDSKIGTPAGTFGNGATLNATDTDDLLTALEGKLSATQKAADTAEAEYKFVYNGTSWDIKDAAGDDVATGIATADLENDYGFTFGSSAKLQANDEIAVKYTAKTTAQNGPKPTATADIEFGINVDAMNFVDLDELTVHAIETPKAATMAAQVATPGVSQANSFKNSTGVLTYTDNLTLQTGARTKDSVNFAFSYNTDGTADMGSLKANLDLSSRANGLNTASLSLADQKSANYAIDQIDKAINKTSMVRATFGSIQNRLEHKITNLTTTAENLTEAESSIRDTDMASEMMNYTKFNILQQAAQSMLAQANQQPQSILQLLG